MTTDACQWPTPKVSKKEAEIYERIRSTVIRSHCSADRSEHTCCGKMVMDRKSMVLSCPLCGDLKLNTEGPQ